MTDDARKPAGGDSTGVMVGRPPRQVPGDNRQARVAMAPAGVARVVLALLTASGALVSAGVHLYLLGEGFGTIRVIGPLFWLNVAAGGLAALLLMRWDHWLPQLFAFGFGALSLAALYVSATRGLYGVHERLNGESEILAQISEFVVVLGAAALLPACVRAALTRGKRGPR